MSTSEPRRFVKENIRGTFGATSLTYKVTAGDTLMRDGIGQPAARLFSFSYEQEEVTDSSIRPVLFVLPGGPGGSSLFAHMTLGPRRVDFEEAISPRSIPPFVVEDNIYSPLRFTDLVFMDPVGTGFSDLLEGGKPEEFYGLYQDAQATADFIRIWLTEHHRWNSPRYVAGQSYGGARAAALAQAVSGGPTSRARDLPGITFNGMILTAPWFGRPEADLFCQMVLPAMARTAWYHERVNPDGRTEEEFVQEARLFAAREYGAALFAGGRLSDEQRRTIALQIAGLTGLSEEDILEQNLRPSVDFFTSRLLPNLEVGRYDIRNTLPTRGSGGDPVVDDPGMRSVPAMTAAFQQYLGELEITLVEPYKGINFEVNGRWNYGPGGPARIDNYATLMTPTMRRTAMRLLVGTGRYDLVVPTEMARYLVDHAGITERILYRDYESGHTVYLDDEFVLDLERFMDGTL